MRLDLGGEEKKALLEIFQQGIEDPSQLDQYFFLSDDENQKNSKSKSNYSCKKVKARNFFGNISYKRLKKNNRKHLSFVINVFSFIILNLNSFPPERKLDNVNDINYVHMMWGVCIPHDLYKFVCLETNYYALNQLENTFIKAN